MLGESQFGIVMVPTISLAESQGEAFEKIKVSSTFLNGPAAQKKLQLFFSPEYSKALQPKIFIMTPETLFGTASTQGLLDQLKNLGEQIRFIAIDEVHLVLECWANFRNSFNEVQHLKSIFQCPILALTAILKPESVHSHTFWVYLAFISLLST